MTTECEKCGGSGRRAVHGGMFGFQTCSACDGTGLPDRLRLDLDDDERRELLDDDLPEVCRACELSDERLRIPGQFLCEPCALEYWGPEALADVLDDVDLDP